MLFLVIPILIAFKITSGCSIKPCRFISVLGKGKRRGRGWRARYGECIQVLLFAHHALSLSFPVWNVFPVLSQGHGIAQGLDKNTFLHMVLCLTGYPLFLSDISSLFQSSGFSCKEKPSHSCCIAQLSLFPPQYYEVVAVVRELHRLGMVAVAVHTLSGTLSPRK